MKKINDSSWKKFHIYDLFEIDSGTKLDKIRMKTDNPTINFVGRSNANNGVTAKVNLIDGITPFDAGNLTLALGGAYLGSCFVQNEPFYTSQNVAVLIPKFEMSLNVKHFIATSIFRESQNNYEAFIKELNAHIKRDFIFQLPVNSDGTLNTTFIEEFMSNSLNKTKEKINILSHLNSNDSRIINSNNWRLFKLTDLFIITGSTTTPKSKLDLKEDGLYPYVTTAATNNGVSGYSDAFTEEGGVLTVDSAVIGTCFYQEKNFTASDHVEKLIPKFAMSKNVGLFLSTIINIAGKRLNYAYNEKRSQTALKKEEILLPADSNGKPDWAYMESYIEKTISFCNESLVKLI